ncbi:SDR family oxidoreductase [Streptomyces sp. JV185]|uniref:SDR family oxidoreductase n=1 Tax=Streptomyces sp. JV185 TaxID=858638 RepID=UPI002E7666E1|nr:SDR family oxidoreductase [Streptomyces sp. JV185]MEE1772491.1 SDR family oxidoreductase [Streptomyces sp. JV185]
MDTPANKARLTVTGGRDAAGMPGAPEARAAREGLTGSGARAGCPSWPPTPECRPTRRRTPRGRLGTPQHIARLALFLPSAVSANITGQVMAGDGGRTADGYAVESSRPEEGRRADGAG